MASENPASMETTTNRQGPRAMILVPIAVTLICVPLMFWGQVWFGRTLDVGDIRQRLEHVLREDASPKDFAALRAAQHGIEQLTHRIEEKAEGATDLLPLVSGVSKLESAELRRASAWFMGQVVAHAPYAQDLQRLVADPDLQTRQNAALAMAGRGDAAAREVLLGMLDGYEVRSGFEGKIIAVVEAGRGVEAGTRLAFVDEASGGRKPVRAPCAGRVTKRLVMPGNVVKVGTPVARMQPTRLMAWEALRALYHVGKRDDVQRIESAFEKLAWADASLLDQKTSTIRKLRSH